MSTAGSRTSQHTTEAWGVQARQTTVPELLSRNVTQYPDKPALTDSVDGAERTWTWSQAHDDAQELAAGLAELDLKAGQTMLIMMRNRAEHWLVDAAATQLGAVPSTVYATFSPTQVLFVARHSRARIVVLEGSEQLWRFADALRELPMLKHVVVLDGTVMPANDSRFLSWETLRERGRRRLSTEPDVVRRQTAAITPDSPVTVLYTSGTTGNPKGVVLSHRNVVYEAAMLREITEAPENYPTVCYLPLAHVAERMTGIYAPLYSAGHVHFCPDPSEVATALAKVRPHTFFAVPRVWEKLGAALRAIPPEQRESPEAKQAILARTGFDRVTWPSSGAAPISRELLEFFASLGVEIREVWGMTETSGAATANRPGATRLGTVGCAVPGVDVRLADDGEILVRGPIVCTGYLQGDGSIKPVIDADGWLHTGDLGTIDEDGFVTIVDRKKELIITSGGKNIAPAAVENELKTHPLIGHALAYADRHPYVVALLALDEEAAPAWARSRGIEYTRLRDLAEHPEVVSEVERAVLDANTRLSRAEQVKRYRLLGDQWSTDGGELTPTMKLKRRVLFERYADVLDSLYT